LVALLVIALLGAPWVEAAPNRFWLQLRGDDDSVITAGRCRILTATLNTEPTIYTDFTLSTAKLNPPTTDSNGVCDWWMPDTVTAVDVIAYVDSGAYFGSRIRIKNVTPTGTKLVRVPRQHGLKVAMFQFSTNLSATNTAVTIPVGALITEAIVEKTHATATGAGGVSVQLQGGGASAICSNIGHASVGPANCAPTDILVDSHRVAQYLTGAGHTVSGYVYLFFLESLNF
jgi:hypothetical protein